MSKDKQNKDTSDRLNTDAQGVNGMENRQNPKSLNNGGFEQDLATPNTSTDDRLSNYYNRPVEDKSREGLVNVINAGGRRVNALVKEYYDDKSGNIDAFIQNVREILKSDLDPISKNQALSRAKSNAVMAYRGKDAEELNKFLTNAKLGNSEAWNRMNYIENLRAAYYKEYGIEIDPDDSIGLQAAEKLLQERKADEAALASKMTKNKLLEEEGKLDWKQNKLPEFEDYMKNFNGKMKGMLAAVERQLDRGKSPSPEELDGAALFIEQQLLKLDEDYGKYADKAEVKAFKKNLQNRQTLFKQMANAYRSDRKFNKNYNLRLAKLLIDEDLQDDETQEALQMLGIDNNNPDVHRIVEAMSDKDNKKAVRIASNTLGSGTVGMGGTYLLWKALETNYKTPAIFKELSNPVLHNKLHVDLANMTAAQREKVIENAENNIRNLPAYADKVAASRQIPKRLPMFHRNKNGTIGIEREWNNYDVDQSTKDAYTQYATEMYFTAVGAVNLRAAISGMTAEQYLAAKAKNGQDALYDMLVKVGRFF